MAGRVGEVAMKVKQVVLFERFNIDWLIRQVNGNGLPIFENRNRKETLDILNNLRKQGYTTIRNTATGVKAE